MEGFKQRMWACKEECDAASAGVQAGKWHTHMLGKVSSLSVACGKPMLLGGVPRPKQLAAYLSSE